MFTLIINAEGFSAKNIKEAIKLIEMVCGSSRRHIDNLLIKNQATTVHLIRFNQFTDDNTIYQYGKWQSDERENCVALTEDKILKGKSVKALKKKAAKAGIETMLVMDNINGTIFMSESKG